MINPAWLVQLVGLRTVDEISYPQKSGIEIISTLAEEGLKHIESSIPHRRTITKRDINSWISKSNATCLTSANPGGVSSGFSPVNRSAKVQQPRINDWFRSPVFFLSEFPMNYREDGSILVLNRISTDVTRRLVSFLGVRSLLSVSTEGTYSPSIVERVYNKISRKQATAKQLTAGHNSSTDIPLGGRTSFQMPNFWTDWALKLCQEEGARATAIWTSALKELPSMASAVVWEKMNPRLTTLKRVAQKIGIDLEFAVTDDYFLKLITSTPDYSRIEYDDLRNLVTKVPVGTFGYYLNGASGYAERGQQEHSFVMTNFPRIFKVLNDGILVSEGIIDYHLLKETFRSKRNVEASSFFIFRSLELELWLQSRQ